MANKFLDEAGADHLVKQCVDLIGKTYHKGDKGDTGETGPQGPIGPQGPKGEKGEGFVTIEDNLTTTEKGHVLDSSQGKILRDTISSGGIESETGNPVEIKTVNVDTNASSFVVNGKTMQAGSGAPSPTNVREISGVGGYDKFALFDSTTITSSIPQINTAIDSETTLWGGVETLATSFRFESVGIANVAVENIKCSSLKNVAPYSKDYPCCGISLGGSYISFRQTKTILYQYGTFDTPGNARAAWIAYFAENPLTIWYKSTDYAKATTFYTVEETTCLDGSYHASAVQLTSPLFDGDSVDMASGEADRTKKRIVLTGTERIVKSSTNVSTCYRYVVNNMPQCYNSSGLILDGSVCTPSKNVLMGNGWAGKFEGDLCHGIANTSINFYTYNQDWQTLDEFIAYVKAQYDAGTPVTIVYDLATPITETTTGTTIPVQTGDSITAENTLECEYGDGLTSALDSKLDKVNVVNNLITSTEGYALDARQGKALNDKIDSAIVWKWSAEYTNSADETSYLYPLNGYYEMNVIVRNGNALYQAILPINYVRGEVFTIGGVYFNGNGYLQGTFTRLTIYTR